MRIAIVLIGHMKYLAYYEYFKTDPFFLALVQTQLRNLYDHKEVDEFDLYVSTYSDNMLESGTYTGPESDFSQKWQNSITSDDVKTLYKDVYDIDLPLDHIQLDNTEHFVEEAISYFDLYNLYDKITGSSLVDSSEYNREHFINSRGCFIKYRSAMDFFRKKSEGKDYDLVFRSRPDAVLMKQLPLRSYSLKDGVFIFTDNPNRDGREAYSDTGVFFSNKYDAIASGNQYEYYKKAIDGGKIDIIGNFHRAWSGYFVETFGMNSIYGIAPTGLSIEWLDIPFKRPIYWERFLHE